MKKKVFFVLIFLLSISQGVYAISSDLKQEYAPGETLIAEIRGNILEPIKPEQVSFLRGHVKVPFDYDIKKLEDRYFLWAKIPVNVTQNYTLFIEKIVTTLNGRTTELDFKQNFSVSGNRTAYSIKPGFIFTKKDFELSIELYQDENRIIEVDFPVKEEKTLKPGSNILKFSIDGVRGVQLIFINIGDYAIPAYIIGNSTNNLKKPDFVHLRPERLQRSYLISDYTLSTEIFIKNERDSEINDIAFVYDPEIIIIQPEIKSLPAESEVSFNISLKNVAVLGERISEVIYIQSKSENFSFALPVDINFIEENSSRTNETIAGNKGAGVYYCSELGGRICTADEVCTGNEEISLDGNCCLEQCSLEKDDGGRKWIGWVLAALVILIIGYSYFRYKKVRSDKNPISSKIRAAEKSTNLP